MTTKSYNWEGQPWIQIRTYSHESWNGLSHCAEITHLRTKKSSCFQSDTLIEAILNCIFDRRLRCQFQQDLEHHGENLEWEHEGDDACDACCTFFLKRYYFCANCPKHCYSLCEPCYLVRQHIEKEWFSDGQGSNTLTPLIKGTVLPASESSITLSSAISWPSTSVTWSSIPSPSNIYSLDSVLDRAFFLSSDTSPP
jgi:hypothetical protein